MHKNALFESVFFREDVEINSNQIVGHVVVETGNKNVSVPGDSKDYNYLAKEPGCEG